jgi:hypothetical protein
VLELKARIEVLSTQAGATTAQAQASSVERAR